MSGFSDETLGPIDRGADDPRGDDRFQDGDPVALIDALYTLSDITAEINGSSSLDRIGLVDPDDIGLIDDLIDALQDPRHGKYARGVLRDALAIIARRTLGVCD